MEDVKRVVPEARPPAPPAPAAGGKPSSPAVAPAALPELTPENMDTVLYPELDRDTFRIAGQTWALRVLPWRWEMEFRKSAQRILEAEMKPFERIIYGITSQMHLVAGDMKVTEALTQSELDADLHLVPAVVTIMLSQDEELKKYLAKGDPPPPDLMPALEKKYTALIEYADDIECPRRYLREIVSRQMQKQRLVESMGERLAGRLQEFASLAGLTTDFAGLKRDFMQLVRSGLAKATRGARTSVSASGPSTGTSRTTSSPTSPAALAGLTPAGQKVAEDLEKLRAQVSGLEKTAPAPPTREGEPAPSAA